MNGNEKLDKHEKHDIYINRYLEACMEIASLNRKVIDYQNVVEDLNKKNKNLKRKLNRFNSSLYSFFNSLIKIASVIYRQNLYLVKTIIIRDGITDNVPKPLFNNFQIFFMTVTWAVIWIIGSIYNGRVMVYLDFLEEIVSFSIGLSTIYLLKIFSDILMSKLNNNVDVKQESQ
tara:strand:+ start:727 stop:1248 length:522 start_codon:yes stop_codon:yes gene_type:complete